MVASWQTLSFISLRAPRRLRFLVTDSPVSVLVCTEASAMLDDRFPNALIAFTPGHCDRATLVRKIVAD